MVVGRADRCFRVVGRFHELITIHVRWPGHVAACSKYTHTASAVSSLSVAPCNVGGRLEVIFSIHCQDISER